MTPGQMFKMMRKNDKKRAGKGGDKIVKISIKKSKMGSRSSQISD